MLTLAYCVIGAMAGILSGLLGIGGGSIVVPALTMVFYHGGLPNDMAMHLAAGTSLASMVVTVSASITYYIRKRMVDWTLLINLLPGVAAGSALGAVIAYLMHTEMLSMIFGLFLLMVAVRELFVRHLRAQQGLPGLAAQRILSVLMGMVSGLLGVGGGASCLPFLLYCRVPLQKAVGVSAGVSLLAAIVGTASVMTTGSFDANLPAYSTGYVHWPAFLGIAVISPLTAPLGARLGQVLPVPVLRRIFAAILIIIGLEMIL